MEVTLTTNAMTIPVGGRITLAVRIRDLDGNPNYLDVYMGGREATSRYRLCSAPILPWDSTDYFHENYYSPGDYTITVKVRSDICYPVKPEYVTKTLTIHVV